MPRGDGIDVDNLVGESFCVQRWLTEQGIPGREAKT